MGSHLHPATDAQLSATEEPGKQMTKKREQAINNCMEHVLSEPQQFSKGQTHVLVGKRLLGANVGATGRINCPGNVATEGGKTMCICHCPKKKSVAELTGQPDIIDAYSCLHVSSKLEGNTVNHSGPVKITDETPPVPHVPFAGVEILSSRVTKRRAPKSTPKPDSEEEEDGGGKPPAKK